MNLSGERTNIGLWTEESRAETREAGMPLFMEMHTIRGGVSVDDVATDHAADLQLQGRSGVRYLRYWVNEEDGKVFYLMEAPSNEAAARMHRRAHGPMAGEIYPVKEGL
jgi:hypothetical protein